MHTHLIDKEKHQDFLKEERHDPFLGEKIKPGDEIVFCAKCKKVATTGTWETFIEKKLCLLGDAYKNECDHKTLREFPRTGKTIFTKRTTYSNRPSQEDQHVIIPRTTPFPWRNVILASIFVLFIIVGLIKEEPPSPENTKIGNDDIPEIYKPNPDAIIMTGAGVGLRLKPYSSAGGVARLQIGTIVSLLDKKSKDGEEWYKIALSNGKEGWVPGKYTMFLDLNNKGQTYIKVAKRRLKGNLSFGTLVDLCNFLGRVSYEVTKREIAAELKLLHLVALQRSLEKIPSNKQHKSRYSNWIKRQQAKIKYNYSTKSWSVKRKRFQQLYDKYSDLSIAGRIMLEINSRNKIAEVPSYSDQKVIMGSASGKKIIMSGAGVFLRKKPYRSATTLIKLEIGTIASLLKTKPNWNKIALSNGKKGWVKSKYTMYLDKFNNQGQAYIEVANRKLSSNNFGDLVELSNFLNRVSLQTDKREIVAELKFLHLMALQGSLEKIPRNKRKKSRYSKWTKRQRAKIKYNYSTKSWYVKRERFQQLYDKYSDLSIAARILRGINNINTNTTKTPQRKNSRIQGKYPETATRYLTRADMIGKSKRELRIMRNEIYARHGYIFGKPELNEYFKAQSWYQPKYSNIENVVPKVNKIEIKNAKYLKKYERQL